jgi:nucleoside-diphosphate kinase
MGATNPATSAPGTIRGDLAVSIGTNVVHGSDSRERAAVEIDLFFGADELVTWESALTEWTLGG